MSLISANANLDIKSAIRLDDATQYVPWAIWAIDLFIQARLLEDVALTLPHYPLGGPATLDADKEWWLRHTKQETIKILRDDAIVRPHIRPPVKFDANETDLVQKVFLHREATAAKENADALAAFKKVYDQEFKKTIDYLKTEARRAIFEKLKKSLGHHYQSAM